MAVQRDEYVAEVSPEELAAEQAIVDRPVASATAVASGWGAASIPDGEGFPEEFKFLDGDYKIVKFIDPSNAGPFAVYRQHWLTQITTGKRSYISPGPNDPLSVRLGSKPTTKYAFTVVNLSEPDGFKRQILVAGNRLFGMLKEANSNAKSGPLTNGYWALTRTGKLQSISYAVNPVKERDLQEDWGVDPVKAEEFIKAVKPYEKSAIRIPSYEELEKVADSLS